MSLLLNKVTFLLLAAVACIAGLLLQAPFALLLGVLLVVVALQKLPDTPSLPPIDRGSALVYAALLAAVAASGVSAWLAAQHNFKFNPVDTALWLAALLLVAVAAIWHDRTHRFRIMAAAAAPPRYPWLEAGLVAAITLVAFGLRAHELRTLPPAFHGDEGEVGMLALRILEQSDPLPIFATTIFGHNPAGFPYLAAPLLLLFGHNEAGLRMLSVFFGTASVPLLYYIGRRGWGVAAAVSAAWLMSVSHFHIHYSRIAVPNIGNAFVTVLLVWLLVRAYDRNVLFLAPAPNPAGGRARVLNIRFGTLWSPVPLADFVAIGLVIGLGHYLYHGARLLPMIAGIAFLHMLYTRKATVLQILVAGLAVLVVVAPLAAFYGGHWEEFVGRSETVFIFRAENLKQAMGADATFSADLLPYLYHQFVTTAGFFTGAGDRSSFYLAELPVFDLATLVLLWLGFGVLLVRIRRYQEFVIAAWLLLGIVFAGFLTTEQPNGPRLITVAPACYLIAGIFVQRAWDLLPAPAGGRSPSHSPSHSPSPSHSHSLAALALAASGLILLYVNWQTYFIDMPRYTHNMLPTAVARAVAAAPASAAVYILGEPILYAEHGAIRFLAGTKNIHDLAVPAALPAPEAGDPGTFVLALEPRLDDLQAVEVRHPGGERRSYTDAQGRFLYATYYLP